MRRYFLYSIIAITTINISIAYNSSCSHSTQRKLLYNVDSYSAASVGLPDGDSNETLPEAICCDLQYRNYAEPNGFFSYPDVKLFKSISKCGLTTFFDSVCGLPLFVAPQNRTFQDWERDTNDHGWPSFRPPEIVTKNIVIDIDGQHVYSICGTYLGTYLPDAQGDRYCIDLCCIAGM